MRAIKYRRKGFPEQTLLTSLRDAKRFPAAEIVALYHERWELELGYDEIKTELLDREETIRSQKPDGVEQEVWGVLLAYNLVRLEMESIAKDADVEPTRISFVEALRLMRDEWEWLSVTSPGAIPKRLQAMRRNVKPVGDWLRAERRERAIERRAQPIGELYESAPRVAEENGHGYGEEAEAGGGRRGARGVGGRRAGAGAESRGTGRASPRAVAGAHAA
jgi:hypothetical protein